MIDVAPLERTELQARLDNAIVLMIRAHVGKPCPTRREVMEWTGIPRRQVWAVLGEVQARGVIEIEVCENEQRKPDPLPGAGNPKKRRMRVAGGKWTDWTARVPFSQSGRSPKYPPKVGYATAGDRLVGSTKLTEDQARAILADKRPRKTIARAYGISPDHITKIRAGKTWAWLKR